MIKIIGPRDKPNASAINTTSRSADHWSSGLSPFKLGPLFLYDNHTAQIFENAWQFAKLYREHADSEGEPTAAYWTWAERGWNSRRPYRYPLGKGRRPLCSLWNGQRLDYIAARKQIYLPLYQTAVAQTSAYHRLEATYRRNGSITLFDFDGYDHASLNMTLSDVLNCPTRVCGHAFILAMMLTYGADFKLSDLESNNPTSDPARLCIPSLSSTSGPSKVLPNISVDRCPAVRDHHSVIRIRLNPGDRTSATNQYVFTTDAGYGKKCKSGQERSIAN